MVADTSSFDTAATSTTWYGDSASTTVNLDCWSCYGWFMDEGEVKKHINDLHVQEHRKDIFRAASIIPKTTEYHQRVMRQIIPSKRNFRGNQSSRI